MADVRLSFFGSDRCGDRPTASTSTIQPTTTTTSTTTTTQPPPHLPFKHRRRWNVEVFLSSFTGLSFDSVLLAWKFSCFVRDWIAWSCFVFLLWDEPSTILRMADDHCVFYCFVLRPDDVKARPRSTDQPIGPVDSSCGSNKSHSRHCFVFF